MEMKDFTPTVQRSVDETLPAAPAQQPASSAELETQLGLGKAYPVMEIFGPTLQGEGSTIGVQTMFIRFGGCDYRCKMCDSLHAVLPQLIKRGARRMTTDDIIVDLLKKAGHCRTVTLSGGNPCMWDIEQLAYRLTHDHGMRLAVETQGTLCPDWLKYCHWITVSPKGPGMGEKFELDKFVSFMRRAHSLVKYGFIQEISVKVVIFTQQDIEFAKQIAQLLDGACQLYLSLGNPNPPDPAFPNQLPKYHFGERLLGRMKVLFEDIKQEPMLVDARFLPQMHVLLWANELGR